MKCEQAYMRRYAGFYSGGYEAFHLLRYKAM
jgi:hypothetical protein